MLKVNKKCEADFSPWRLCYLVTS